MRTRPKNRHECWGTTCMDRSMAGKCHHRWTKLDALEDIASESTTYMNDTDPISEAEQSAIEAIITAQMYMEYYEG